MENFPLYFWLSAYWLNFRTFFTSSFTLWPGNISGIRNKSYLKNVEMKSRETLLSFIFFSPYETRQWELESFTLKFFKFRRQEMSTKKLFSTLVEINFFILKLCLVFFSYHSFVFSSVFPLLVCFVF